MYTLRSAERAARVFRDEPSMSSNIFKPPIHDWQVHVLISANYIENEPCFNYNAWDPFVHSNNLCFVHSNNLCTHYRSMLLQKPQSLSSLLSIKLATSKSEIGYGGYINIMKYGHIPIYLLSSRIWNSEYRPVIGWKRTLSRKCGLIIKTQTNHLYKPMSYF